MKILLTGANGMVGKNTLEHPNAERYEWLTPCRSELDLLDASAVAQYIRAMSPDLIIHSAGRVGGIQANMNSPFRFFIENLDMGRNLVLGAKQAGVARLINLGSTCMYPRSAANPLTEEMILTGSLEPTNEGYALAKVSVSRLCQYLSQEYPEFQYKTIIPCNLYGRHDKFDPIQSHFVPAAIIKTHNARVKGLESVEIWGDGTARRELMYAGDLADCLMQAIENYDSMPDLMNVGTGVDETINSYYEMVGAAVNFGAAYVHNLDKPVGMTRRLASVAKARAWGWQAKTSLQDGISLTYQYYLSLEN
jgi:GDP-L-fucose synthase